MLGSLNVRNVIRERGEANIGVSLGAIDNLKLSAVDNRKVNGLVPLSFSAVAHPVA